MIEICPSRTFEWLMSHNFEEHQEEDEDEPNSLDFLDYELSKQ